MKHTKRRRRRRSTRGGGIFRMLFGGFVDQKDDDAPRLRKKCIDHFRTKVDPHLLGEMCGGYNHLWVPPFNGPPLNYYFYKPKPSFFS